MRRLHAWTSVVAWSAAALLAAGTARADGKRYYIDESTDFTGNGCQNADLNDVTSSLRETLDDNGWSGSRFTNASA